jgi:RNA polymerase sigma factor (sigma-70 family)
MASCACFIFLSINSTIMNNPTAELENIFRTHYQKLYAYAFRMTGKHEDTQDVLQNAYIKAHKGINSFRGDSSLNTWIYRIIVNESYRNFELLSRLPLENITEKEGITEKEFFERIDYDRKLDDDLVIEDLREKCLLAFLKCVPQKQRVCFLLRTHLELSYDEIAEVMEISTSNVKVLLHRGRQKLQELFFYRCNLIDPEKPCKCYLWIKYMRDHNREIPTGYRQLKNESLEKEHFRNMSVLKKIDYLYTVEAVLTKEEFLQRLRELQTRL